MIVRCTFNKKIILKADRYYSGTSGLVLPIPQALYPNEFQGKSRLSYYASQFNSVEINSSFYKTPKISTVMKWAESVPSSFRFTFKLSKTITHVKGLEFKEEDVVVFMRTIDPVGDKKGCLLVQLPPGLKMDKLKQLQKLFGTIQDAHPNHGWKVAVEFRHPSWYHEEVYMLLENYGVSMVIHDLPVAVTPLITSKTSFRYLRFHGPGGRYRGSYTDDFLINHAEALKRWAAEGKTVYFYFNNTMGDAVKNLQTLNDMVKA